MKTITKVCPPGKCDLKITGDSAQCRNCPKQFQRCESFGTHCSICKYHFADGDDICSGFGHEVGHWYPRAPYEHEVVH